MNSPLAKIKKNASSELWIALNEYQGKLYLDVREHFFSNDERGWLRTKKGIMLSQSILPSVIDGIEQIDGQEFKTICVIPKTKTQEIHVGFRDFDRNTYAEYALSTSIEPAIKCDPLQRVSHSAWL